MQTMVDSGSGTIKVTVISPNHTNAVAMLPTMIPVGRIAKGLAARLDLPTVSPAGAPIDYSLCYQAEDEVELLPTQTLEDAGVRDEATLKLRTQMQAG